MLSGFGGCARRLRCLGILFLGSRYSTVLQSKDNACNRDTSAQARFRSIARWLLGAQLHLTQQVHAAMET